jgi:hypothetical protein
LKVPLSTCEGIWLQNISALYLTYICEMFEMEGRRIRGAHNALVIVIRRGLKPPHQHGPIVSHHEGVIGNV